MNIATGSRNAQRRHALVVVGQLARRKASWRFRVAAMHQASRMPSAWMQSPPSASSPPQDVMRDFKERNPALVNPGTDAAGVVLLDGAS
jgi:hypothetical protein